MYEQLRDGDGDRGERNIEQTWRDRDCERETERQNERQRGGGGKEQEHWEGKKMCRRKQETVPLWYCQRAQGEEPMSGMGWRHLTRWDRSLP